jgi:hypothetical protein
MFVSKRARRNINGLTVFVVLLSFATYSLANNNFSKSTKIQQGQYFYYLSSTPKWIHAKGTPSPKPFSDQNQAMRYLLLDRQENVSVPLQRFSHLAIQALTVEGVESLSKVQFTYNPSYERLHIHSIRVYRKGEAIDKLGSADISLIQREKDLDILLYDGRVTALAILNDIRIGDVLEYAYTIEGSNPVFGNKYFSNFGLGWSTSFDEVYVRVIVPRDRSIIYKSFNTIIEPKVIEKNDIKEFIWAAQDTVVIQDEGEYPNWYDPFPWVQISEYTTWHEVKKWANSLYRGQENTNATVAELVNHWQKQYDSNIDRASAALRFVQNEIRYFGVEYGFNSHLPSNPSEVLDRRYGDCKDKSLLLATLLNAMGIEANPTLVSAQYGKAVESWLPSPGAFDHVIVKTKIDGRTYWVDPTMATQEARIDKLPTPKHGKTLVVDTNSSELETIAYNKDNSPLVVIDEKFDVNDQYGSVKLDVTTVYTGSLAQWQRRYFKNNDINDIKRSYLNYYERLYKGVEPIADLDVVDDASNDKLTIHEQYKVDNYFKESKSALQFDVYGYSINQYTGLPKVVKRQMPLSVYHPVSVRHRVNIRFPKEVNIEIETQPLDLSDDSVAYKRSMSFDNSILTVDFGYTSKKDVVPADRVASHIGLLKNITSSLSLTGSIKNYKRINEKKKKTDELVQELLHRIKR